MTKQSLDMIGIEKGTDKSSLVHGYLQHYEQLFTKYCEKDITILEIGVLGGSSLRMWQQFFPKGRIVGVDINAACRELQNDRVTVEIGSQDDPGFLLHICNTYQPTIIIDDGSHRADHVIFTFERLFPHLSSGGCYVIEDLVFHFGSFAAQSLAGSTIGLPEYLFELCRDLMAGGVSAAENKGMRKYAFNHIDEILFFRKAACITKKDECPEPALNWAEMEALIAKSDVADNWRNYGTFLLKNGGPIDRAEAAMRRAVDLDGSGKSFLRLSTVLERRGRLDDAIAAARRATELEPTPVATAHLDRLVQRRQKHAQT
jgi:hypothetical protein